MNFKKTDYVVISIICFFLGFFLISQVYAGRKYQKIIQPQNNEVFALEIAKLNNANADLRREIRDLTSDLNIYRNSSESKKEANEKYQSDVKRLDLINGAAPAAGQGTTIKIKGNLSSAEVVDLINAVKNIGAEAISINGERLVLQTDLAKYRNLGNYEITVLGNSKLLKSAIERKGGIMSQLLGKDISINVSETASLKIAVGQTIAFKYAKIVK